MTSSESIRRIALEAKEHPERAKLSLLAYDALVRQAEGKALFVARDVVDAKAEQLGVTRDLAESESGNLLVVLERGAMTDVERKLVAAFAVLGLRQQATTSKDTDSVVARFVRAADWLELATPYVVYGFVDRLLDDATIARIHRAIADAAIEDSEPTTDARARNLVRLVALATSETESARDQRSRVAPRLSDPVALAILTTLRSDEGLATVAARTIEGSLERTAGSAPVSALRVLSGFAALAWIGRTVLSLARVRRTAELSVVPLGLRIVRRTTVLGRPIRERTETISRGSLELLARDVRYPSFRTLVGLVALASGALVGATLLGDGIRSGSTKLVVAGLVVCLAGAALDLVLDVILGGVRGRVALEIHASGRRAVRVSGIPVEQADVFLESLARPSAD